MVPSSDISNTGVKAANNLSKLSKSATNNLKERWKASIKQHQRAISNIGKFSEGASNQRKEAWKEEIKNIQQIRQDISAPQQAGQTELFSGLRSGKTRMQKHRDENPELNQLRQQLYDNNRGQLQLSGVEKAAKIARIQEIVAQNKVMKEQGQGPKLGRPAGGQAAKTRSDKGIPRGPPKKK